MFMTTQPDIFFLMLVNSVFYVKPILIELLAVGNLCAPSDRECVYRVDEHEYETLRPAMWKNVLLDASAVDLWTRTEYGERIFEKKSGWEYCRISAIKSRCPINSFLTDLNHQPNTCLSRGIPLHFQSFFPLGNHQNLLNFDRFKNWDLAYTWRIVPVKK